MIYPILFLKLISNKIGIKRKNRWKFVFKVLPN